MPRSRRFLFLSLAAIAVGVAVGMWLLWPRTVITPDNASRIRQGITIAEVEAILGGPERDESTGPLEHADSGNMLTGPWANGAHFFEVKENRDLARSADDHRLWLSNMAIIGVWFRNGRVSTFYWLPVRPTPAPITKPRRWLRL
jgi:hypothetical protein